MRQQQLRQQEEQKQQEKEKVNPTIPIVEDTQEQDLIQSFIQKLKTAVSFYRIFFLLNLEPLFGVVILGELDLETLFSFLRKG